MTNIILIEDQTKSCTSIPRLHKIALKKYEGMGYEVVHKFEMNGKKYTVMEKPQRGFFARISKK